jgi:hypothetical protein
MNLTIIGHRLQPQVRFIAPSQIYLQSIGGTEREVISALESDSEKAHSATKKGAAKFS